LHSTYSRTQKAGQKVSKAGQWDIAVKFWTVPPKAGRLAPIHFEFLTTDSSQLYIPVL